MILYLYFFWIKIIRMILYLYHLYFQISYLQVTTNMQFLNLKMKIHTCSVLCSYYILAKLYPPHDLLIFWVSSHHDG